ncbi:MAG: bifunctional phosphoglucose/phosphomannose isomerase [Nitrososphaerota archaeon]|nr:bifunctional phosphoglucose/phosphomannose isomerase [Aigarchaeota archaeon]MDW8076794.1 bifunctional phosphoglucose/phosphomannose isomerase [Nitrososphaerota archaeon]
MRLDEPGLYERPEAKEFLAQLRTELDGFCEGMRSAEAVLLKLHHEINSVVFLGVGGSGIVGDLLSDITTRCRSVPIICHKDYSFPSYITKDALVVAVSYSGNTAETLSAMVKAYDAGLSMFAITSGGLMGKICKKLRIPMVEVRTGLLPRMAVPYMLGAAMSVLERVGAIKISTDELKNAVERARFAQQSVEVHVGLESNLAKQVASCIYDKIPFIYSHGPLSSVGYRLKCQLNENAKMLAVNQCLPEILHNDIEGWSPAVANCLTAIVLRCKDEHPAIREALDNMETVLGERFGIAVSRIVCEGNDEITKILSAMVVCDYISFYTAMMRGVDPVRVDRIKSMREGIISNVKLLEQVARRFGVEL